MKNSNCNIHTHKNISKYNGDMARRIILRYKNCNNIITERPFRNRHRHVPTLRSCTSADQTMKVFTTPINLWSMLSLV